ncbi:MAG: hypothetical protein M0T85_00060 [Dehalococcoidales bacterium]|nr:hypothetical protein [Dehalococcoidales bacterium]
MAAQRAAGGEEHREIARRLKQRFSWLIAFSDDELRDISMCTLEEGDVQESDLYFDISHPERGAFKGQKGKTVPEGSCYVSRGQVDEKLWNKLVSHFGGR